MGLSGVVPSGFDNSRDEMYMLERDRPPLSAKYVEHSFISEYLSVYERNSVAVRMVSFRCPPASVGDLNHEDKML